MSLNGLNFKQIYKQVKNHLKKALVSFENYLMSYFQLNNVKFYDMLKYLTIYLTTFIESGSTARIATARILTARQFVNCLT
jgi:hypothetical protein